MVLSRTTPVQRLTILAPRWHDRTVLLANYKVGTHNEIVFTKAKSMMDNTWYISGEEVKKHPKTTNGTIACFSVPISSLQPLERTA